MKTIAIVGPESAGKTTLSGQLAEGLEGIWVPEYARDYLNTHGATYQQSDLDAIAEGQRARENWYAHHNATDFLVLDTDMLVLYVWSLVRYGTVSDKILHHFHNHIPDLYVLCTPDLPWESDALREHPSLEDRQRIFEVYARVLNENQRTYIIRDKNTDLKDLLTYLKTL